MSASERFHQAIAKCFASIAHEADTTRDGDPPVTLRIGAHLAWADDNDLLFNERHAAQRMRTILVEPHPQTYNRLSKLVASERNVIAENVAACPTRLDATNVRGWV